MNVMEAKNSAKDHVTDAKARLNENGRIVIPAEIRQRLNIKAGDVLLLRVEGDVMVLEPQQARVRRVQESLRQRIPASRVLSDELIADRREEANREIEEWLG
jgi:AbrB family looped-hinge helix DNA binding protein